MQSNGSSRCAAACATGAAARPSVLDCGSTKGFQASRIGLGGALCRSDLVFMAALRVENRPREQVVDMHVGEVVHMCFL